LPEGKTKVEIPKEIANKIKKRIEGTGFKTIDEYVGYVLSEVLSEIDEDESEGFSAEDEEKVKERLRALGYLD